MVYEDKAGPRSAAFGRVRMLMEPNRDGMRLKDCTRIVALRATCGGGVGSWRCTTGPKAPDRNECS